MTYGLTDNADMVVGIPYLWTCEEGGSVISRSSDTSLELKWRFFERDGLSLAFKPGATFPTGDEKKGFGSGRTGYRVFFLASKETSAWGLHANAGYTRNENIVDIGERKDIWHASLAGTYSVVRGLKAVANIGIERSRDKSQDRDPAFALAGVIYSVSENSDLDFGVKRGLNETETDYSLLAGATFRF